MTNREAIKILRNGLVNAPSEHDWCIAFKMAIEALEQECSRSAEIIQYRYDCEKLMEENERLKKALEQEPILDKIRAEIKALSPEPTAYDVVDGNPIKDAVWEIIADVLKIIDKYKGEGEV